MTMGTKSLSVDPRWLVAHVDGVDISREDSVRCRPVQRASGHAGHMSPDTDSTHRVRVSTRLRGGQTVYIDATVDDPRGEHAEPADVIAALVASLSAVRP
jgi:hypothetical protein